MWCYIEDRINHVHAAEPQYNKPSNTIKSLDEYNNILHPRNSKVSRKEPWYNKPHNLITANLYCYYLGPWPSLYQGSTVHFRGPC